MLHRSADLAGVLLDLLRRTLKLPWVQRAGAALFLFVIATLLLSFRFYPERVDLEVGQVAPRTIKAPRTVVFEDKVRTEELRREAASRVPRMYDLDPKVVDSIKREITEILTAVAQVTADQKKAVPAKEAALKEVLPFPLSDEEIKALVNVPPARLQRLAQELGRIVDQVMAQGISQEELAEAKKAAADRIELLLLEPAEKALAHAVVEYTLRPNKFYNAARTEMLQKEAAEAVPPVQIIVRAGEKIIGEGEVVTPEHIAKLKAVGLYQARPSVGAVLGVIFAVLLLILALFFYIYQEHRGIYNETTYLYLVAFTIGSVLLLAKFIMAVDVRVVPGLGAQLGYAVPVATAGMVLAILLDARLASVAVGVTAILVGMMAGNELRFMFSGFLTGMTGVLSVSRLNRRGDLVRAGLYVSGVATLAALAFGLLSGIPLQLLLPVSIGLGLANGLLSSILTNGALPVIDYLSGISSPVKLLELTNPGEPLLKRLLIEAPGTYHHSILVGNLGEAAAEAIGADVLVVRAGAYYHDIGKLRRPYFFVENQMGQENPHDKLAPTLSTLIVTSHVKDGVELARAYKLPQRIVEIIEQHHGTSLVGFFYQKALEADHKEPPNERDFRYPGPKPQTREAAIVMLADAVEAAVRSLGQPAPGQVEGLVRRIIKEKLYDGQLDESALTFRDLELIASAFTRVLSGIFHSRLEYPEREGGKEDSGDSDSPKPARKGAGVGRSDGTS